MFFGLMASETWSKIMVSLIMFVVLCVKSLWWNICTCQKTASHVSAQLQRWFSLVGSFSLGFAEVPNDTHDENVTVSVWKGVPKPQFNIKSNINYLFSILRERKVTEEHFWQIFLSKFLLI